MPAQTLWPLRQALNFALRRIVLTQAAPTITAYLARILVSSDPAKIPVFGDAQVVVGDVPVPPEPTLCIVGIARRNQEVATGTYLATLTTQIRLKTPWAGDSTPEDYEEISSAVFDHLEDVFTSLANRTITPTNPANGSPLLPPGAAFYDCRSLGSNAMNFPQRSANGVTSYAGAILMHTASLTYTLDRTGVTGT